jgi:molybdenum cofactor guanylyltransferase
VQERRPATSPDEGAPLGLILAGGQGIRMRGISKPLALFRGRTLLSNAVAQLAPFCRELLVSANDPAVVAAALALGLRVVRDTLAEGGPLAGLLAGLESAQGEGLFVLPCDTPLLGAAEVVPLLEAAASPMPGRPGVLPDVVAAEHEGGLEPLVGWYGPACTDAIAAVLARGERKVLAAWQALLVRRLWCAAGARVFANVNSPEDLARLERDADASGR